MAKSAIVSAVSNAVNATALKRKVPSDDLRLLVSYALGIETQLEGHEIYPSLYGRLPDRPDASEFFAKIETMLENADMESLWREPDE